MDFWADERGQPVQIGFILLFGILVLAFASYQGYVVPNQNAQIEFNHFQTVEDQFTEFQSNLVNAVGSETERATTFSLGVQYPSRLIALNPPPVSGQLRTTEPGNVSIVDDVGDQRVDDICGSLDATSRSLVYSPGYNELDNAEATTYENGFVARTYREGTVFGDQRLVKEVQGGNDRIDLTLLNGSVSENGQGSYSLEVNATHRYAETVTDPTITIPSQFDSDAWEDNILEDYNVVASDVGGDRVALEFTGEYKVSCAVAGLGGAPEFEPPTPVPDSPTEEMLSAPSISTADLSRYEELGTVDHIFGTNSVESVSQYDLTYEVEAVDENLDKVALYLKNTDDEVVTATTQTVPSDSAGKYEGRWITPWINNSGPIAEMNKYTVGIEVFGKNSPSQSGFIEVGGELQIPVRFEVDITDTNSPVDAGSSLGVDVTVQNTGQEQDTQTVELRDFDGNVVDSQQVTLNGGESEDITLTWQTDSSDVGTGEITVSSDDDSDTASVEVRASGGGGGGMADGIRYNGDARPFNGGSGVRFSVSNAQSSSAAIESISVETDDAAANSLRERNGGSGAGQHEIYILAWDSGWYDAGDGGNDRYPLGTEVDLTNDARINGYGLGVFYLTYFHSVGPGGSGSQVDIQNDQISVTLHFTDGSETTLTFQNGNY